MPLRVAPRTGMPLIVLIVVLLCLLAIMRVLYLEKSSKRESVAIKTHEVSQESVIASTIENKGTNSLGHQKLGAHDDTLQDSEKENASPLSIGEFLEDNEIPERTRQSLGLLGIDFDESCRPLKGPTGKYCNFAARDGQYVGISLKTGELSRYAFYHDEDSGFVGNITRQDATHITNGLLLSLGLTLIDKDWVVEKTPTNIEWVFTRIPTHKGIPGSGKLQVVVSTTTGRIVEFTNIPQDIPERFVADISDSVAMANAKGFLNQDGMISLKASSARLEIVYPNNFFTLDQDGAISIDSRTRLCWVVDVIERESGESVQVYVDAGDGAIVGGR